MKYKLYKRIDTLNKLETNTIKQLLEEWVEN